MAALNIFLSVILILTIKDKTFSCPTRSHKAGSYLCPPSLPDSISDPHRSSATSIPCKTESGLISGSSSLPISLTLPTKTNLNPDTLVPSPVASFPSPTPNVYSNNYLDLVNTLTKMLSSSPSNVALPVPQIPLATQFTLPPYLPASNTVRGPVKIPKPHFTHSSHATLFGSGPCSSGTLPGLPDGFVPPSITPPSPSVEIPYTAPTLNVTSYLNVSGENTEHSNDSQIPSSDVVSSPANSSSNAPKLIPLSRLCAQFSPASHNGSVPVSDTDAVGHLSITSPGLRPCGPPSSTGPTVPGAGPESPVGELLPTPGVASIFSPGPAPASTSKPSTVCGGRKPSSSAVIDLFRRKHSSSTPEPRPRPPPCPKTAHKGTSLGCVTPSGPGALPKPTAAFVTLPPVPVPTPTANAAVPSGYNPAFMQLLINRLISNSSTPLLSSLPCLRPSFNVTPGVFPASRNNVTQTSTPNKSPCDVNTITFDALSDKPTVSTLTQGSNTTVTPSTSLCNNPAFANLLCKLLVSSLATSKTHFPPCPSPSNINLTSLFNHTSAAGA